MTSNSLIVSNSHGYGEALEKKFAFYQHIRETIEHLTTPKM